MIRQSFNVKSYWKVIVFYNIDYDFFDIVADELKAIDTPKWSIDNIYNTMSTGKALAFTQSNLKKHMSIVGFNRHKNSYDYLNSIVHEAEHIKQAMLEAYSVDDKDEPPAYTIGYLIMRMYDTFKDIIV